MEVLAALDFYNNIFEGDFMGMYRYHFERYINLEYWEEHYQEILKSNFHFPQVMLYLPNAFIRRNKIEKLISENNEISKKEEFKYCENYDILRLIEFTEEFPQFKELIKPCVLRYKTSVSLIFSRPSARWGLRGDPYFWRYMEEIFLDYEFPMDLDVFEEIIEKEFFKLSGKKLEDGAYIEQFSHGGMSSGSVSSFWVDVCIPLLKYRLIQSNNDYYLKHKENSKIIENTSKAINIKNENLDRILSEYDFEY